MGFKFNQRIGPEGFKINIDRRGVASTSVKITPGVTYNSKRGLTLGVPGTGLSYNAGKKKRNTSASSEETQAAREQSQARLNARLEYNRGWREYTGGYNRKEMISSAVCLALCVTPLWLLGSVLAMPSLSWFLIDTLVKMFRYNKYLKNQS